MDVERMSRPWTVVIHGPLFGCAKQHCLIDMAVELLSVDGVFRSRIRRFRPPVLRRFRRRRIRNGREMKFPPDRDFSGIDVREETGQLGKLRYGRERHGAW